MKKQFILTIVALFACFASFASIMGPGSACVGTTSTFIDSTIPGGSWYSTFSSVATVDASGNVTALTAGTTVIYCFGAISGVDSVYFTVYAAPGTISASASSICVGSTASFSCLPVGGTWSSSSSYVATLSGNVAYGSHNGTTSIIYTTTTGCTTSVTLTVGTAIVDSVFGASTVCLGSATTFTDLTPGGAWSSSNPAIATVNSSGVVSGVAAGSAIISYGVTNSCGTSYATHPITIISGVTAGTITGPTTVQAGNSISLSSTSGGGTWTITPSTVATINATSGLVSGLSAGAALVTYTVSGCGGVATATYTVNVTTFNGIQGDIFFNNGAHYGPVKVWLITYAAPNLSAIDSQTVYVAGTSVHYSFTGMITDTYRVKAAVQDSIFLGTGYIPTYHDSSYYWYNANVIPHTAGTGDINKNIYMAYGAVTTGPGFVGGNVTTGANKGTAGGVPVKGLMMYLFNSSTMQLLQATRTDATGAYSFSNLPVGQTYFVFPDSLNYSTIPYTSIALTVGSPSVTAASFVQHTISHVIAPVNVGIQTVSTANASIIAFPNPTTGKVSIAWTLATGQDATVAVCDITGREVYRNTISMNVGSGADQIDLSSLNNGLYIISVKGENVSYNNKIQIAH